MGKRHDKIGIKQALRLEWMNKVLDLKLAGLPPKEIRKELHIYLSDKKDNGTLGKRGKTTTEIAVCMLMNVWGNPTPELQLFYQELLKHTQLHNQLSSHWAMINATYPFWFKVALHTGRLFNLQDQTTKKQIIQRIREEYGDRSSVVRSAQRVIQAFVAWGVLKESTIKGCYEKGTVTKINNNLDITFLYESALYALPEGKLSISALNTHPAFFPFDISSISSDIITQHTDRIDVVHYATGDELLVLKNL